MALVTVDRTPAYEHQEYPRLVYQGLEHKEVEDDESRDAALAEGWFLTLGEAKAAMPQGTGNGAVPAEAPIPPSIVQQLVDQINALGLRVQALEEAATLKVTSDDADTGGKPTKGKK